MFRTLALPVVVLALLVGYSAWERAAGTSRPLADEELEAYLTAEFDLREVALGPPQGGRVEGTGTRADGRAFRFDIAQRDDGRTVVARWERPGRREKGEGRRSTSFADHDARDLLLGFGYLVWVGKRIRDRTAGARGPHSTL